MAEEARTKSVAPPRAEKRPLLPQLLAGIGFFGMFVALLSTGMNFMTVTGIAVVFLGVAVGVVLIGWVPPHRRIGVTIILAAFGLAMLGFFAARGFLPSLGVGE